MINLSMFQLVFICIGFMLTGIPLSYIVRDIADWMFDKKNNKSDIPTDAIKEEFKTVYQTHKKIEKNIIELIKNHYSEKTWISFPLERQISVVIGFIDDLDELKSLSLDKNDFSTELLKYNKMNGIKGTIPKEMKDRHSKNIHKKSIKEILDDLEETKQYILNNYDKDETK